jgi:hypothetical protein
MQQIAGWLEQLGTLRRFCRERAFLPRTFDIVLECSCRKRFWPGSSERARLSRATYPQAALNRMQLLDGMHNTE